MMLYKSHLAVFNKAQLNCSNPVHTCIDLVAIQSILY